MIRNVLNVVVDRIRGAGGRPFAGFGALTDCSPARTTWGALAKLVFTSICWVAATSSPVVARPDCGLSFLPGYNNVSRCSGVTLSAIGTNVPGSVEIWILDSSTGTFANIGTMFMGFSTGLQVAYKTLDKNNIPHYSNYFCCPGTVGFQFKYRDSCGNYRVIGTLEVEVPKKTMPSVVLDTPGVTMPTKTDRVKLRCTWLDSGHDQNDGWAYLQVRTNGPWFDLISFLPGIDQDGDGNSDDYIYFSGYAAFGACGGWEEYRVIQKDPDCPSVQDEPTAPLRITWGDLHTVSNLTPKTVNAGSQATFSASLNHTDGVSGYSWAKNGVPLAASPRFTGLNSSNLKINPALPIDAGDYTLKTTFCNSEYVTPPAKLTVVTCAGDLTYDKQVDDADFSVFVVAYERLDCADPGMPPGCPADLSLDSLVDDSDFSLFVVAYDRLVCP